MQAVITGRFHRTPVAVTSVGQVNRKVEAAGGYYCIRPGENSGWLITGHVGGPAEHVRIEGTDPTEASEKYVALLYQVAVDSDATFIFEIQQWSKFDPKHVAPGFRPGMAKRALTHLMNMQRKARIRSILQFKSACEDLFAKGWPAVPMPHLPWEKDASCQQQLKSNP